MNVHRVTGESREGCGCCNNWPLAADPTATSAVEHYVNGNTVDGLRCDRKTRSNYSLHDSFSPIFLTYMN